MDPTVFVVDDEPKTRSSFAALISSLGLAVEVFDSGEAILPRLETARPGCAVVDFRLRGMDGLELHRRFLDAGCHLPVILISGYLDVQTTARAMEQGVFRVLEKPYRNDELAHAVLEALKRDRALRNEKTHRLDIAHRLESLDARERLTLEMIVAGSGNRAVERRLGLSTRTVDRIRASILQKMEFLSFVELSSAYGAASKGDRAGLSGTPAEVDCPATGEGGARRASSIEEAADLPWLCCDLHDGAAQYLSAALMRIQVVEARQDIPEEVRTHLRETGAILAVALAEIRDIIAGKSPGLPKQSELVSAIQDLLLQLVHPHGIEVEFVENLQGERIPSLPGMAAYRILQECVNNAIRHSGSKRLRLELIRESDTLRLEVRDWGCGFHPDVVAADHRGLQGIRHRAELLGGSVTIHSEPRKGTLVTVGLPLAAS